MKAHKLSFIAMIFVFLPILLSCGKNEKDNKSLAPVIHDYRIDGVLYGKDSKLKHVYHQGSFNSEYQYDEFERISRINYGVETYAYEVYHYNTKGELENRYSYTVFPDKSPVLNHTVVYLYDAKGNKEKEETEFSDGRETECNLYKYSDGKLTKRERYEGNRLTYYIVYEYKGDLPVMEKFYVPGEDDFATTEHFYEEGLLVYSKWNWGSERNYYDKNDNLIKRVANIPSLSSSGYDAAAFYITWEYEYF